MTEKVASGSRKAAAIKFLTLAGAGQVREAFGSYVASGFRHHNPYFAGDSEALAAAMAENAAQNPHKRLEVLHALEDGDFVATHSRVRLKPEAPDLAVAHLFRFEGPRIAELWDIGQSAPAQSPNRYGMF